MYRLVLFVGIAYGGSAYPSTPAVRRGRRPPRVQLGGVGVDGGAKVRAASRTAPRTDGRSSALGALNAVWWSMMSPGVVVRLSL